MPTLPEESTPMMPALADDSQGLVGRAAANDEICGSIADGRPRPTRTRTRPRKRNESLGIAFEQQLEIAREQRRRKADDRDPRQDSQLAGGISGFPVSLGGLDAGLTRERPTELGEPFELLGELREAQPFGLELNEPGQMPA